MLAKIFFVCLLLSFSAQSNGTKTVTLPKNANDNILESIKELLKEIENANKSINEWTENVKELIELIDVDEIVTIFEKTIKEIIDAADISYEKAQKCIDAEQEAIVDLSKQITDSDKYCKNISKIEEFQKKLETVGIEINERAQKLSKNINARAKQCVDDNKWQWDKLKECINELVDSAQEEVNEFVISVQDTVNELQHQKNNPYTEMFKCVNNVFYAIEAKENRIINDFQSCINEIVAEN